jgi:hypothetical protein
MAIHRHITGSAFDLHTTQVLVDAYECARRELDLPARGSSINSRIADLVLNLARHGERDPQIICKRVVTQLQQGLTAFHANSTRRSPPTSKSGPASLRKGQRVSRKDSEEEGTVVEADGGIKVKWDRGRTSYYRRDQRANVRPKASKP